MKVCIISGRYPATKFNSVVNHRVYADVYGYDYIHCNWPTRNKNLYLNKIDYILEYFENYDYIIWIDDDAFFYDFSLDIMIYKPTGDSFISFCKSPSYKSLKTYLSSGQFILKCSKIAKSFLEKVKKEDLNTVKAWWNKDLGYFTNGDQDAMIYNLLNNENFIHKCTLYNYKKFNSRAENLIDTDVHKPLILHFTGTVSKKYQDYLSIQKQQKLDSSLVPHELLSDYKLVSYKNPKVSIKFKLNNLRYALFGTKK